MLDDKINVAFSCNPIADNCIEQRGITLLTYAKHGGNEFGVHKKRPGIRKTRSNIIGLFEALQHQMVKCILLDLLKYSE
jgi:hypothetical protein